MNYCVYVLTNAKKEIYVGQTGSLAQRIANHNAGESERTRDGRPWWLLYSLPCDSRKEALALERYIYWRMEVARYGGNYQFLIARIFGERRSATL